MPDHTLLTFFQREAQRAANTAIEDGERAPHEAALLEHSSPEPGGAAAVAMEALQLPGGSLADGARAILSARGYARSLGSRRPSCRGPALARDRAGRPVAPARAASLKVPPAGREQPPRPRRARREGRAAGEPDVPSRAIPHPGHQRVLLPCDHRPCLLRPQPVLARRRSPLR